MIRNTTLSIICLLWCGLLLAQNPDEFNSDLSENPSEGPSATGSFGEILSKLSSFVSFNGYVTNEFKAKETKNSTFDQHYFNIFVTAQLTDKVSAEAQLEYEHAGQVVELRYGFIDYKVHEAFVIRTGYFLTPAGIFNEYLYPEYLTKTVERAFVNREISPSAWSEVGLQFRGRLTNLSQKVTPFYAVYVVNGLHGASGGGIRGFRANDRDDNNNKAVGGTVGFELNNELKFAFNYYTGKYDDADALGLDIFGASLYYDKNKFSFWAEYQAANQDAWVDPALMANTTTLNKNGFYVQAGYMVSKKFEPIIRYDQIALDGDQLQDRDRLTLGLNYHIAKNAVAKANYDITNNDGEDVDDNQFSLQLSIGF